MKIHCSSTKMNAVVINMISGPCSGKSVLAAELFVHMKKQGYQVEYLQEYAKTLVWLKDFDMLNNQHLVSYKYFRSIKVLSECKDIQFVILDSSLLNGLYYNRHNFNNTSDMFKTESLIMDYYGRFKNINLFVHRGKDYKYDNAGRIENENESKLIDSYLQSSLEHRKIPHKCVIYDDDVIANVMQYINSLTTFP